MEVSHYGQPILKIKPLPSTGLTRPTVLRTASHLQLFSKENQKVGLSGVYTVSLLVTRRAVSDRLLNTIAGG